jgi:hypothetical protein
MYFVVGEHLGVKRVIDGQMFALQLIAQKGNPTARAMSIKNLHKIQFRILLSNCKEFVMEGIKRG